MAIDPNNTDYDGDGIKGSANDLAMAAKDTNKDGVVSPAEKAVAEKKTKAPKDTTAVTTYDPATGKPLKTVATTPGQEQTKTYKTAADFGVSKDFLEMYPDMVQFVRDAIDKDYSKDEFFQNLEKTQFGQDRTRAEEAFDIAINGPEQEDLRKKVTDKAAVISKQALAAGIQLTPQQVNEFAQKAVRSDLSDNDVLSFVSSNYQTPEAGGKPSTGGTSSSIYQGVNDAARSYGLTMTDQSLQQIVRDGLNQGANWQNWLEGQKNVFREQAKLMYPTIADRLDKYTFTQLVDPYMNTASQMLGINKENMNPLDPTWSGALNGPNGPLSNDEWMRVLKTDSKFGWDKTTAARQQFASLGDQLLNAFGMA
jgi:hypothetical protein